MHHIRCACTLRILYRHRGCIDTVSVSAYRDLFRIYFSFFFSVFITSFFSFFLRLVSFSFLHAFSFSRSHVYTPVAPSWVLRNQPHPVSPCWHVGVTLSALVFPLPVGYIVRCLLVVFSSFVSFSLVAVCPVAVGVVFAAAYVQPIEIPAA